MHSGVRVISRHYVHTRGGDRLTMEARGPGSTAITVNNRPANVSKFDSSRSCYSLLRAWIRSNKSFARYFINFLPQLGKSFTSFERLFESLEEKNRPFSFFHRRRKIKKKLKNKKRCQSLYLQFFMNEIYKGCQNWI